MAARTVARLAVAAAVVAGTVGGVAAPAWAPKYIFGTFAFGTCDLPDGESRFDGDLTVQQFVADGGALYVDATLTGVCVDGLDVTATAMPGVYRFPVVTLTAECNAEFAGIDVRPGEATVGGTLGDDPKDAEPVRFDLDLYPSTIVERTWMPNEPMSVRGRLCAISRMAGHSSAADIANQLNQLVLRV